MVKIFSKENCSNCEKTKELFQAYNMEYEIVNISVDKESLKKVKELGFKEAPVVFAGEESWSGYKESKIISYCLLNNKVF